MFALLGIYVTFWFVLFILPLVPNTIESLTNKPNRNRIGPASAKRDYEVSQFGYFTELQPGRVKIITRGGEFVRCIMNYEDHLFLGEAKDQNLKPNNDRYWEVGETKDHAKARDSHPIPWKNSWMIWVFFFFSIPWWVWKRWVMKVTGFVFTGIYPYQRVRTYPLEYFIKKKEGSSQLGEGTSASDRHGEEKIYRIEDYSDHFRVADFQFPIRVPSADTKDKIPVRVFVDIMAQVFNPYQTAYWIDDWSARLSAAAVDAVTHYTRGRHYDDVISITDESKSREFSDEVLKIGNNETSGTAAKSNSVTEIGIKLSQALIIDISPVRDEDGKKLGELARARVERQSMEERAVGLSANLRKQAEAVRENGHIGLAVLAAERNVRTAEAAGAKAIVVIGGSNDVDPIQAAILHELKQQSGDTKP